jgi:chromosome segregation ATPase
MQLYEENINL